MSWALWSRTPILTDGDDYGFNDQLKAAYGDILRPMDGFRSYEPAQLTAASTTKP